MNFPPSNMRVLELGKRSRCVAFTKNTYNRHIIIVCVVYKVVKVTCHINGAVRLLIEGDWSNGIRQSLIGATEVYQLTKVGSDEYELSPSRNYTPVDRY